MVLSAVYIVRLSGSVFQVLGLVLTTWRVYIRIRISRFWWEDGWATILLLVGPLFIATQWVFLLTHGLTAIIAQWIFSICYTSIVMLVRLSVLFSIIRIIHGRPRLLKFSYACVVFFVVCWAVLIAEKVVQCASDASWHSRICILKPYITIFQLTIMILVVLPLRILWRARLRRRQRRMILSIFASSVTLAFAALLHTIGQILDVLVIMTAGLNLEIALSLWVCNLLIVVTFAYRFLLLDKREGAVHTINPGLGDTDTSTSTCDDNSDDDFTTRLAHRPATTQVTPLRLTTVDLDVPTVDDLDHPLGNGSYKGSGHGQTFQMA